MVTIIDPHIKRDDAYHVKKMASEKQLFVRNKDGQEYDGWCWPGTFVLFCSSRFFLLFAYI
jgi:alpha 1,3-glucosidase